MSSLPSPAIQNGVETESGHATMRPFDVTELHHYASSPDVSICPKTDGEKARTRMYRVVVHVAAREVPETFEFLEDTEDDAQHFVEEVTRIGFWIDTPLADTLFPPSAIELVEVLPDQEVGLASDDPVQLRACG